MPWPPKSSSICLSLSIFASSTYAFIFLWFQPQWHLPHTHKSAMLLSVLRVKPTFFSLHLAYHFFSFLKTYLRTQYKYFLDFPGGSDWKESPAVQETWVQSLGWEDLLEEGTATHSSTLAWRQRSLLGYNPWGHKELAMTEQEITAQQNIDISYSEWNSFGMVLITNSISLVDVRLLWLSISHQVNLVQVF